MAYKLCKLMISAGRTDGLADKVDVFFAANRLTSDEYLELIDLITLTETDEA